MIGTLKTVQVETVQVKAVQVEPALEQGAGGDPRGGVTLSAAGSACFWLRLWWEAF